MKEKKDLTEKKTNSRRKPMKGSNWKSMKTLILKSPKGSRKRRDETVPMNSLKSSTKSSLESLLNPDGKGTKNNTPVVAMDCEMVGIGRENLSALARVSIVNFYGAVLYDKFVKPQSKVTDYRTKWSGIRKEDLEGDNVVSLRQAQDDAIKILKRRIVVGHSIDCDFDALMLNHPKKLTRDTARYEPLMRQAGRKLFPHKLSFLLKRELGQTIQEGEHDSVDDARATLLIYKKRRAEWEDYILHPKKGKKMEAKYTKYQEEMEKDDDVKEESVGPIDKEDETLLS